MIDTVSHGFMVTNWSLMGINFSHLLGTFTFAVLKFSIEVCYSLFKCSDLFDPETRLVFEIFNFSVMLGTISFQFLNFVSVMLEFIC